jgi:NAD(P)-dependent dehydrogenase (short-subunit alcohol dehydrogenase family)
MQRLKEKVIAVAGGAGGIGSELSRRYAAEGAKVLVGDLNADGAAKVAAEIKASGGVAEAVALDLANEDSIKAFVARAEEAFGGLDGLHANAAYFGGVPTADTSVVDIDMAVYDQIMQVNARGYVLCTRYAVPAMLRRGGGSIVYTSSGAAFVPDAGRFTYSMSKAAVHALMRHVAERWGREGVRANVITPGVVIHEKHEKNTTLKEWAMKRVRVPYLGQPSDIAAMGALLLSEEGRYITGQVISVDGGSSMRQ